MICVVTGKTVTGGFYGADGQNCLSEEGVKSLSDEQTSYVPAFLKMGHEAFKVCWEIFDQFRSGVWVLTKVDGSVAFSNRGPNGVVKTAQEAMDLIRMAPGHAEYMIFVDGVWFGTVPRQHEHRLYAPIVGDVIVTDTVRESDNVTRYKVTEDGRVVGHMRIYSLSDEYTITLNHENPIKVKNVGNLKNIDNLVEVAKSVLLKLRQNEVVKSVGQSVIEYLKDKTGWFTITVR